MAGGDTVTAILATLNLLASGPIELRALTQDRKMVVERFRDPVSAAAWAGQRRDEKALYVVLNPFNPALVTGAGVTDAAIVSRRWLLIDVDPARPTDSNATDQELELSVSMARTIEAFLSDEGWPLPVRARSGNGAHLLYRIDLPNDPDARETVNGVLQYLASEFSSPAASVDTSVGNAARITKLYGTITRKGPATDERPHRPSKIERIPDPLAVVPVDRLEALAARRPQERRTFEPKAHAPGESAYDLRDVLSKVHVRKTEDKGGSILYHIACPWQFEHTQDGGEKEATIFQSADGALAFKCLHSHCSDRDWKSFRDHLAIDTKAWKERDKPRASAQPKPQPKPEPERSTEPDPRQQRRVTVASADRRAALLDRMDAYARTGAMPGAISSGMERLNGMLLGGFRPGKFYVLGGETGRGKTTLLMQWALVAARRVGLVGIVTPEMDDESIDERVLAAETGLSLARYRDHPGKGREVWAQHPIPQNIRASFDPSDIMAFVAEEKPDMLIVDYAQQAVAYDAERRHTALAQLGADCLTIAKERRIPVLLGTQVNVTAERDFSIRETRILEHQADAVIYIDIVYSKDVDGEGRRQVKSQNLLIAKNRHGYAGKIPIEWRGDVFRFTEA